MPNVNKIILAGHLGRDVELKHLSDGKAVANVSMAVSDGYGERKQTTWFNLVFWNKTAETAAQYLKKGSACMVIGRIYCEKYTAKDGTEKEAWKVSVSELHFLGGKAESSTSQAQPKAEPDLNDDFPF